LIHFYKRAIYIVNHICTEIEPSESESL